MNIQRIQGIEKEITRIIGKLMYEEVKNPKVKGLLSVIRTTITKDAKFADVYISVLQGENERQSKETIQSGLTELKGFLRKRVSQELKLRIVPEIRVNLDDSIEYGVRMNTILNNLGNSEK
jgi:ribosome-binding factor A